MAFISTFIDRPGALGRGAVGSSNLATGAVYRQKLGASSVGTTAQGTLTAAKVIGTLSTIDIGSALLSYGSAGSSVGAFSRFRYGSVGTVRGAVVRGLNAPFIGSVSGRVGSYGSALTGFHRGRVGSYVGTVIGPAYRGRFGSFAGSVRAPYIRGVTGSFTRYGGSVNAAKVTHGSLGLGRVPPLGSLRGSVPLNTKAFGTLADTRLPRQLVANKGTVSGVMGSFARYGGSIRAPLITHGSLGLGRFLPLGSLRGSVPLNTKAFGTLADTRLPRQLVANKGTVSSVMGSFARYGGSIRAPLITHGSLGAGRIAPIGSLRGTIRVDLRTSGTINVNTRALGTLSGPRVGTFEAAKLYRGTLTAARLGPLQSIPGTLTALKTVTLDVLRGTLPLNTKALGTLANTRLPTDITAKGTLQGRYGSAGTASWQLLRGRYGSFSGTVRGGNVRGDRLTGFGSVNVRTGSFGTLSGQFARGRYGSFTGTVRAGNVRGVTGSFARHGGSVRAGFVTHGTIVTGRMMQVVGTHKAGSIGASGFNQEYIVWPSAFPDRTYKAWAGLELRQAVAAARAILYRFGINNKAPGSIRYWYANSDSITSIEPIGTIYVCGVR